MESTVPVVRPALLSWSMIVVTAMSVGSEQSRTALVVAVVDRVRRDAVPRRPDAGHHHHVVRDGLHHRQRPRRGVPGPSIAQRLEVGHVVDLAGPAAVDHEHVGALAHVRRGRQASPWRVENSSVAPEAPATLSTVRRSATVASNVAAFSSWHISRPPFVDAAVDLVDHLAARRGGPRLGAADAGRLVGAVADDEPVHLHSLRGDVEDREAVVVEVEVLQVRVVRLERSPRRRCSSYAGRAGDVLEVAGGHRGADELDADRVPRPGVGRLVGRQVARPAGVDVAGDEDGVGDAVVAQVLEQLPAVVGVAVPLVDVVRHALRWQQARRCRSPA